MDTIQVTPERKAQLEEYAQRHGQDRVAALDNVLADYFAWEKQDLNQTVAAALKGYADVNAGRTKPADEVYQSLRLKHRL